MAGRSLSDLMSYENPLLLNDAIVKASYRYKIHEGASDKRRPRVL